MPYILSFLNDKLFGHPCDKMDFAETGTDSCWYIKPLLSVDTTIQAAYYLIPIVSDWPSCTMIWCEI